MTKVIFVINMQASQARGRLADIKAAAAKAGLVKAVIWAVEEPKQIDERLAEAFRQKPDVLVVGGGDGTIASAISRALQVGYTGKIGLLPVGTANYLARNVGVPLKLEAAVASIAAARAQSLYFPRANGVVFMLLAAIGVSERVSAMVPDSLKRQLGQLAYVAQGVRQLVTHEGFEYRVYCDDEPEPIVGISHEIVVTHADMNTQVAMVPGADVEERQLQLTIFASQRSKLKLLLALLLYACSFGRLKRGLITRPVRHVRIETTPARGVSVDGEVKAKTPLVIDWADKPVSVICPELTADARRQ